MGSKIGKPRSKRTPVRLRHKIEKASAAKQRKQRKLAKKNPEWRSKIKKDPGIPNLFPYKDRILAEIEEKRRLKEEELQRKKLENRATLATKTQDVDIEGLAEAVKEDEELATSSDNGEGHDSNPMAALLASARARATEYGSEDGEAYTDEDTDAMDENPAPVTPDAHAKSYSHLFSTVLSQADVLLYVLDARDPSSTRSRSIERQIAAAASGTKRLVLVLNKIDLVPPNIVKAWLKHLRRDHPTLPLRASSPAANARTFDHKSLTRSATADALLRALKAYAATQNLKRALTVGVVGFPNVGKSSVINVLVSRLGRSRAPVPVGAEAGVTTALRPVKLDNKLTLLDSPGVVFPSVEDISVPDVAKSASKVTQSKSQTSLILLNALPPKAIDDPVPAISLLLSRVGRVGWAYERLLSYYNLSALHSSPDEVGDVTNDFLIQVARKRGRLSKGGVPNLESAARGVLGDWWAGRIGAWVDPPGSVNADEERRGEDIDMKEATADGQAGRGTQRNEAVVEEKVIVAEWAKPFFIEGLFGEDNIEFHGGDEMLS